MHLASGIRLARALPLRRARPPVGVAIAGLGGSAAGADLARAWSLDAGGAPVRVIRDYRLPRDLGRHDLLIASSYSGDTEETLAIWREAARRGMPRIAIGSGGALARAARREGMPWLGVPSGLPPRMALGYLGGPLPVLLWRVGAAPSPLAALRETVTACEANARRYAPGIPAGRNPAKRLALAVAFRSPALYGSQDRTDAAAVRFRCQLGENAKMLASVASLPELDHNEVVGWEGLSAVPAGRRAVVTFEDPRDHARIRLRWDITVRLIRPRTGALIRLRAHGASFLARLYSLVALGDHAAYYAALARGTDPHPIPSIMRLKAALAGSPVR